MVTQVSYLGGFNGHLYTQLERVVVIVVSAPGNAVQGLVVI